MSRESVAVVPTFGVESYMEVIKQDDILGSIASGKLADIVLLKKNPLENTMAAPYR